MGLALSLWQTTTLETYRSPCKLTDFGEGIALYSMKKMSLNNYHSVLYSLLGVLKTSCSVQHSLEAPIHLATAGTRDNWNRGFDLGR